jgi:hypothetical protein
MFHTFFTAIEAGFRSHHLPRVIPQRRTAVARELVANSTAARQKKSQNEPESPGSEIS